MTQRFIDAVKDAYEKHALALKTEIRKWCDHKLADGRSAIKGCPDFHYCDICGKTIR